MSKIIKRIILIISLTIVALFSCTIKSNALSDEQITALNKAFSDKTQNITISGEHRDESNNLAVNTNEMVLCIEGGQPIYWTYKPRNWSSSGSVKVNSEYKYKVPYYIEIDGKTAKIYKNGDKTNYTSKTSEIFAKTAYIMNYDTTEVNYLEHTPINSYYGYYGYSVKQIWFWENIAGKNGINTALGGLDGVTCGGYGWENLVSSDKKRSYNNAATNASNYATSYDNNSKAPTVDIDSQYVECKEVAIQGKSYYRIGPFTVDWDDGATMTSVEVYNGNKQIDSKYVRYGNFVNSTKYGDSDMNVYSEASKGIVKEKSAYVLVDLDSGENHISKIKFNINKTYTKYTGKMWILQCGTAGGQNFAAIDGEKSSSVVTGSASWTGDISINGNLRIIKSDKENYLTSAKFKIYKVNESSLGKITQIQAVRYDQSYTRGTYKCILVKENEKLNYTYQNGIPTVTDEREDTGIELQVGTGEEKEGTLGQINISGLPSGYYLIVETTTPEGYQQVTPKIVYVGTEPQLYSTYGYTMVDGTKTHIEYALKEIFTTATTSWSSLETEIKNIYHAIYDKYPDDDFVKKLCTNLDVTGSTATKRKRILLKIFATNEDYKDFLLINDGSIKKYCTDAAKGKPEGLRGYLSRVYKRYTGADIYDAKLDAFYANAMGISSTDIVNKELGKLKIIKSDKINYVTDAKFKLYKANASSLDKITEIQAVRYDKSYTRGTYKCILVQKNEKLSYTYQNGIPTVTDDREDTGIELKVGTGKENEGKLGQIEISGLPEGYYLLREIEPPPDDYKIMGNNGYKLIYVASATTLRQKYSYKIQRTKEDGTEGARTYLHWAIKGIIGSNTAKWSDEQTEVEKAYKAIFKKTELNNTDKERIDEIESNLSVENRETLVNTIFDLYESKILDTVTVYRQDDKQEKDLADLFNGTHGPSIKSYLSDVYLSYYGKYIYTAKLDAYYARSWGWNAYDIVNEKTDSDDSVLTIFKADEKGEKMTGPTFRVYKVDKSTVKDITKIESLDISKSGEGIYKCTKFNKTNLEIKNGKIDNSNNNNSNNSKILALDSNGKITIDLPEAGYYLIEEVTTNAGYQLADLKVVKTYTKSELNDYSYVSTSTNQVYYLAYAIRTIVSYNTSEYTNNKDEIIKIYNAIYNTEYNKDNAPKDLLNYNVRGSEKDEKRRDIVKYVCRYDSGIYVKDIRSLGTASTIQKARSLRTICDNYNKEKDDRTRLRYYLESVYNRYLGKEPTTQLLYSLADRVIGNYSVHMVNKTSFGNLKILKLTDGEETLSGAKFKVAQITDETTINDLEQGKTLSYEEKSNNPGDKWINCTLQNGEYIYDECAKNMTYAQEFTTSEDGTIDIKELPIGWYRIRETAAPTNYYELLSKDILIKVIKDETVKVEVPNSKTFHGKLTIIKRSLQDITLPLEGAKFNIKNEDGNYVVGMLGEDGKYIYTGTSNNRKSAEEKVTTDFVSNKNGIIEIIDLPAVEDTLNGKTYTGKYTVEEIKAPDGYMVSKENSENVTVYNAYKNVDNYFESLKSTIKTMFVYKIQNNAEYSNLSLTERIKDQVQSILYTEDPRRVASLARFVETEDLKDENNNAIDQMNGTVDNIFDTFYSDYLVGEGIEISQVCDALKNDDKAIPMEFLTQVYNKYYGTNENSDSVIIKGFYARAKTNTETLIYYNSEKHNNLKIEKIDRETGEPLNGVEFIIKNSNNKYLALNKNAEKIWVDTTDKAMVYTTGIDTIGNEEGTIYIQDLPGGDYTIVEYDLSDDLKEAGYDIPKKVETPFTMDEFTTVEPDPIVITNSKYKYISLSGYVWQDVPGNYENKTESTRNNLYDGAQNEGSKDGNFQSGPDYKINGIKVALKNNYGDVVTNGDGKKCETTTKQINGKDGYYLFENINSEDLNNLHVEFTYDGLIYKSVETSLTYNNYQISSKASEKEEDRKNKIDNPFKEVTGEGQNLEGIGKLKYQKDNDNNVSLTNTSTIKKDANEKVVTVSGESDFYINATTQNAEIYLNDYYSDFFGAEGDALYINLGLYERERPDLWLQKDIFQANVGINGQNFVYKYNSNLRETGYDTTTGVQFQNSRTEKYRLPIYRADAKYESKDNTGLKISVVYKIALVNASTNLYTKVNSIDEYFSEDYVLSKIYTGNADGYNGENGEEIWNKDNQYRRDKS